MKNKDLIAKLQQFDPELEVAILDWKRNELGINGDGEPEIPEDVLQKLEEECEDDCEYADSELSAAWKMGYMVRAKAEYLRHLTAQTPESAPPSLPVEAAHFRPLPSDKPYANLSPLHSAMWIVLHGSSEMSHRKEVEEELENLRRWLLSYPRWVEEGYKSEKR